MSKRKRGVCKRRREEIALASKDNAIYSGLVIHTFEFIGCVIMKSALASGDIHGCGR
jgi:hypothetical protein